jgi:sulfatase modifying factor 1
MRLGITSRVAALSAAPLMFLGCNAILGIGNADILDGSTLDAGQDAANRVPKDASAARDGARMDGTVPPPDATRDAVSHPDVAVDAARDAASDTGPRMDTGVDASAGGCDGLPNTPTSCLATGPGLSTCGVSGVDCCCASPMVPGGTYDRTYANSTLSQPSADPATVSSFRLDKYEVTVGRFREYVDFLTGIGGTPPAAGSGKHTHLNGSNGLLNAADAGADAGPYETGWDPSWDSFIPTGSSAAATWAANLTTGCTNGQFSTWSEDVDAGALHENLPINCVGWYAAYAFCIWDGGFLPSEAEREYAAAGGSMDRNYAWGSASPGSSNEYAVFGCNYPSGSGQCDDAGSANFAPVGMTTKGVGLSGQLDLGGNVWEYALDSFSNGYSNPCNDCTYEAPSPQFRISRGGGFADTSSVLVAPFRGYGFPTADSNTGIRCARP